MPVRDDDRDSGRTRCSKIRRIERPTAAQRRIIARRTTGRSGSSRRRTFNRHCATACGVSESRDVCRRRVELGVSRARRPIDRWIWCSPWLRYGFGHMRRHWSSCDASRRASRKSIAKELRRNEEQPQRKDCRNPPDVHAAAAPSCAALACLTRLRRRVARINSARNLCCRSARRHVGARPRPWSRSAPIPWLPRHQPTGPSPLPGRKIACSSATCSATEP